MNKRLKLQCWNCQKTYFETLEITDQQEVIVRCPYCRTEAVVNLKPYRKQTKTVFRGENKDPQSNEEFNLPDVLPTKERK